VRENTLEHYNQVKRGEEEEVNLSSSEAGGWRLKRVWIGFKIGELVSYFNYFDLVTQFEIWESGGSD
jgi:hypothetical protein